MKAVKGNKEYMIDESQQKSYQDAGFDIIADGEVIAYGRGKTVPYGDYMQAVKEIGRLQERVAELEAAQVNEEQEMVTEKKTGSKKVGE